jgi:hypothetical protein
LSDASNSCILTYLWVALVEDTILFVMAWIAPDIWFRLFHIGAPAGLEIALLRRSAGQWAAFALAHAITLWRWLLPPPFLNLLGVVIMLAGYRQARPLSRRLDADI